MRNLYFILLCSFTLCSFGQETLYKNYKVTNFIDFLNDGKFEYDFDKLSEAEKFKVKFLMKEKKCMPYDKLTDAGKAKIDANFKLVRDGILPSIELKDCSGNSIIIDKSNVDNSATKKLVGIKETLRAGTFENSHKNTKTYKAGLLFKDSKLYVNLWPFKENSNDQTNEGIKKTISKIDDDDDDDKKEESLVKEDVNLNKTRDTREVLFYEIPDDHTAKFRFTEVTLTAITIPLKYRFKTDRDALDTSDEENVSEISVESEEFSTSVNLAFFGGWTWGNTKFTHRKKIGNRTTTTKNTIGAFVGSTAVELKTTNTDITLNQPQGDREGTFGTISFGLGYVKSWNKISIGLFGGIDKGVGRVSEAWVYDGKPWLGIGVGYDLFKL